MAAEANLVLTNARIWTGEYSASFAEALAIKDDSIIAVGSKEQIRSNIGKKTEVLDLGGNLVLPGFNDNHTHLMVGGFQLLSIDLRGANTGEKFIQAIAAKAVVTSPGQWITGGGWNHDQWPQAKVPAKEWIDGFTPHIPVFVTRTDLHMGLANSAALRLAGITRETADPVGGVIERVPDTGDPTGILKDRAMDLLRQNIPAPTEKEYEAALTAAMQQAAQLGITSVQDITAWNDWKDWETFKRFQEQNKLTLRIYARTQLTEWQKQLALLAEGFCGDNWLRFGGVKGFVDGSLGSTTALMFEPYTDAPETKGLLTDQMFPAGIMKERIAAADKAGLPVSVHAIGDRANHILLNIFEEVIRENGPRDRRFRIEHAQHLLPSDIERMSRLGVLASVQPSHVGEDGCWAERRIGSSRCLMTYAFRSLMDAGVTVTFGTDWPVVPLNPFQSIYTAVTRQTQDGRYPAGWIPEQKVTVTEAVRAYTTASAYAECSEASKGSLTVGKLADLIVVSQDIFTVEPEEIPKIQVLCTIAGGKIIYIK